MEKKLKLIDTRFKSKRVLVTGSTGFKGSWLCEYLLHLGADVTGVADKVYDGDSHFSLIGLDDRIVQVYADIRDADAIDRIIFDNDFDFIFHLAAQPLVKEAYANPRYTFNVNAQGTINLLDAIYRKNASVTCVFITSDKCYENVEQIWGYRETDVLGGKDPYSASKAMAEIAISSYKRSIISNNSIRIATARAGNVIGGGDFAADRIIPDAIRCVVEKKSLMIRSPNATRPWQHVLEPLNGYLNLAIWLEDLTEYENCDHAYNFGPSDQSEFLVTDVIDRLIGQGLDFSATVHDENTQYEAKLLKLNCDKAYYDLGWSAKLSFYETIERLAVWYLAYIDGHQNLADVTRNQIKDYHEK